MSAISSMPDDYSERSRWKKINMRGLRRREEMYAITRVALSGAIGNPDKPQSGVSTVIKAP